MKKILSMLLCALLVMSSMATVAFADAAAFTFEPTMALEANDVIKAGTKVRFDFTAATGTEATYYNNGVAVDASVVETVVNEAAGTTTTTVAIAVNAGKNAITAKVGDTESAATIIYAEAYVHQENFYGESTYATIGQEVEIGGRTGVIKPTSNSRIANNNTKKADIFEVSFDLYMPEGHGSGKLVGFYYKDSPTSAGGYLDQIVNVDADGKTLFPCLGENPTGVIADAYFVSADEWHTVKYYINDEANTIDYYIDDILILKDHNVRTPGQDFVQVQCFWTGTWDGLYVDNFQANGMTSTSLTSTIASGTATAGAKVSVTAKNLRAGQSVVGYVNGAATTLGTADGTYTMAIPAGYSTISAAILDADSAVAKAASGKELKAEGVYEALSLPADDTVTVITDDDFSATPVAAAEMPVLAAKADNWPQDYYDGVVARFNANINKVSEGGNPGEMVKYYHSADIMIHNPLTSPAVDANEDGLIDLKTTTSYANSGNIYAGNNISNFENIGLIEYSFDVKFGDDFNQSADTQANFISFAAKPAGSRTWFYPVLLDRANGGYITAVYKNGKAVKTPHTDIDVTQWHTIKFLMDPTGNRMWIYCDDALIDSGDMGAAAFTSVERMGLSSPRTNSAGKHVTMYADNIYYATHSATYPTDLGDDAIVNAAITETGATLGIVPANLGLDAEEAIDIAVVARGENGVEIQKYEGVTSDSAFKVFNFNGADIDRVFVWNWATLAPLGAAIE